MRFTLRLLLLGLLLGSAPVARAHGLGTDEMADAANALLRGLAPELRAKASFPLSSPERKNWTFAEQARKGVALDELGKAQLALAHELLKNGLSPTGYDKATLIMAQRPVQPAAANSANPGNPRRYYLSIFGRPSADAPWGWRVEGPGLSLNFTIADEDNVAVSPAFFGSDPTEVQGGPRRGLRVLGNEDLLGRNLVKSLTEAQRKTAILPGAAPAEIITGNDSRVSPLVPAGLPATRMTAAQRQQLMELVTVHARRFRLELGDEELLKIIANGWDTVAFAWTGGIEQADPHHYRIHGPTFLIEFEHTEANGGHDHTVWRDFAGDFGRDLLNER